MFGKTIKTNNTSIYLCIYYYLSHILHAGWEGAGGGLHAARLNTRVAKQPKAKQLHKLFSAVPLDFTNQ